MGFIGVPNAGKSTLLAATSNARPKIADYPFTTIVPNLGVCDVDGSGTDGGAGSGKGLVLADIPGLLEGAHEGVGLGLAFLRHVQRCRVLIHVLRGDSEDVVGDLRAINQVPPEYCTLSSITTDCIVLSCPYLLGARAVQPQAGQQDPGRGHQQDRHPRGAGAPGHPAR